MTKKTFRDLGIAQPLLAALEEQSITDPFPIQELTIPLALAGTDLIGQARTGTGKTLAFGLPLLQRVDVAGDGVQALVVTPTRELCLQVTADLAEAGAKAGTRVGAFYGGVPLEPQQHALRSGLVDVIVGTPGRLLDHVRRGTLDLSGVRMLVLDEADEMLDMGFLPDVEQLIHQCADRRQTLLFSATMAPEVVALARRYLSHPTFIRADADEQQVAPDTEQHFFLVHRLDKPRVLARVLQSPQVGLAAVFVRTKRMADRLVEELRDLAVNATAIHGDLRQARRERNLDRFRAGRSEVLIATEVAARGLDIEGVTHVFNYDCPDDERMYLHRIGRTGRAGAAGVAVTFATFNEVDRLNVIRKALGVADEPLQEVFSTSQLLTERFGLPAETPWGRFRGDREEDTSDAASPAPMDARDRVEEVTPPPAVEAPPPRARTRVRTRTGAADRPDPSEPVAPRRVHRSRTSQRSDDAAGRTVDADESLGQSDGANSKQTGHRGTRGKRGTDQAVARQGSTREDGDGRPPSLGAESSAPGQTARGGGRPTLARRVRVEHLP
ncbi:MAG: DEAD/DEAH box helicase [Actinomycetota bacterium]|nr:DEAD/DEAH box helicase [Actinomycetota bacterium]